MVFRRGLAWLAFSVGAGAGASALTACSLLLGEGFTDPSAQVPTDDSGPDGSDAPTGGGDGSTSTTDGGDGSTPGTDGGDSGGASCPLAAVSFCDDFKRTSAGDIKGAWDEVKLNPSGALSIVADSTGDNHLKSAISALGGQAQLWKTFVKQPTKLHFELSLTVKTFASAGDVYVTGVGMSNGSDPPTLIYFYVSTTALYVVQQVANGGGYVGSAIPISLGMKQRVVLDLEFAGTITVTVDGVTKLGAKAQMYLVPKPPTLYLGAVSIDGTGDDGSFDIDDFVFTID